MNPFPSAANKVPKKKKKTDTPMSVSKRKAYIDISGAADGLLALTPAASQGGAPKGPFAMIGAEQDQIYLYYNGADTSDRQWLACPSVTTGEYYVYPEKAFAKSVGKDQCTVFEVNAKQVEQPTQSCIFY